MTENAIKIFENEEFGQIRIIEKDGEAWFVGKDVATALGYKEPTKAAREKVDVEDKVSLLLGGAVDYVTKPFDTKELLARITVALRVKTSSLNRTLEFEDITLDTFTYEVFIEDKKVKLTRTEYAILKLLIQNPKQVIVKSFLLEKISEDTPDCTESSLKMHISNLRKKLRDISGKDYIEAVWGIGFKMRTE